jgi:hypothetical protein
MLSNRALRNFEHYMKSTPARDRGYVVTQHGFRMRARPVGAYDAAPNKRAVRDQDFEKGGAMDNEGCDEIVEFLRGKLKDSDLKEVTTMLEALCASAERRRRADQGSQPQRAESF